MKARRVYITIKREERKGDGHKKINRGNGRGDVQRRGVVESWAAGGVVLDAIDRGKRAA
jgi:hypothetical protein